MFGVRRDLMRLTDGNCTLPAIRNWQPTPVTAPRQRLVHTNPRCAACAISTAQYYHLNVWSYSSSGIGSAPTPALCNHRSCPASALRFPVWSNSSSGIASNTASGAATSCPFFISRGGERAGAIAGAHGWLTYMFKNMPHRRRLCDEPNQAHPPAAPALPG